VLEEAVGQDIPYTAGLEVAVVVVVAVVHILRLPAVADSDRRIRRILMAVVQAAASRSCHLQGRNCFAST
jgi:hypothetical protein